MLDVERYVMCTCTCIQPPLESLNTEYKLPVYMSVRDWKGGFTRTEVKDSKNFEKFCCKGTVWSSCM